MLRAASFLAAVRSLVNFSRTNGSLGMAPINRESLPPASPQDSFLALADIGQPFEQSRASGVLAALFSLKVLSGEMIVPEFDHVIDQIIEEPL
jgi:hypothetical protein